MIFQRANGSLFRLEDTVRATIDPFRQRDAQSCEAGGILLGRVIVEPQDVIVDAVTVPGGADRRSRFQFFRARAPAQSAINRAWSASEGTQIYLGEWHTHPEDDPQPSPVDLRDWDRLARTARFEQPFLFFVIAGRIATNVWEVPRGGGRTERLQVLTRTGPS